MPLLIQFLIPQKYIEESNTKKKIILTIDYQLASLDRYYVEFENSYNTDSKKNESLSKQIYKIYKEYREIFDSTIWNLRDLGKKKIEVRNLDVKLDILSSKGYKLGVEKVKHDLQDIKAENARLEKHQWSHFLFMGVFSIPIRSSHASTNKTLKYIRIYIYIYIQIDDYFAGCIVALFSRCFLQITFPPLFPEEVQPQDLFTTSLFGEHITLYTHSYLCYGMSTMADQYNVSAIRECVRNTGIMICLCIKEVVHRLLL